MKKTTRAIMLAVLSVLMVFALVACGPGEYTLTSDKTTLTEIGAQAQLTAKAGETVINDEVEWTSDTPTVASVKSGVVTAHGNGKAKITGTIGEGDKAESKTVEITVNAAFSLTKTAVTFTGIGKSETVDAKMGTANANNLVTWSTDKAAVATVSNGVITAVGAGTATVSAKIGSETKTVAVTVTAPFAVDKTIVDFTKIGEATLVTASIGDNKNANSMVTWASDKPEVATVVNGVITAIDDGKATITATYGTLTEEVTVNVSYDYSLSLDAAVVNLITTGTDETKKEHQIVAELTLPLYYDAFLTGLSYSSTNTAVAKVDAKGKITAVGVGVAEIMVKTNATGPVAGTGGVLYAANLVESVVVVVDGDAAAQAKATGTYEKEELQWAYWSKSTTLETPTDATLAQINTDVATADQLTDADLTAAQTKGTILVYEEVATPTEGDIRTVRKYTYNKETSKWQHTNSYYQSYTTATYTLDLMEDGTYRILGIQAARPEGNTTNPFNRAELKITQAQYDALSDDQQAAVGTDLVVITVFAMNPISSYGNWTVMGDKVYLTNVGGTNGPSDAVVSGAFIAFDYDAVNGTVSNINPWWGGSMSGDVKIDFVKVPATA